jgi:hypothetical protein
VIRFDDSDANEAQRVGHDRRFDVEFREQT